MSTQITRQLNDLIKAKEKGFAIPDELIQYTQIQDRKARGIRQVWTCPCGDYESEVRLKAVDCANSHARKLTWQHT